MVMNGLNWSLWFLWIFSSMVQFILYTKMSGKDSHGEHQTTGQTLIKLNSEKIYIGTRMHSSRMHTAHYNCWFSYHACPPTMHAPYHTQPNPLPCIPSTMLAPAMHASMPCMPPTHAPHHAHPTAKHAPLPYTPSPCHAFTLATHTPVPHMPPLWTEWQTGVKHYLPATLFAGSKNTDC